jgi:uncharacterized protein YdeI (YjbR/CyaY-like superfamily)
MAGPGTCRRTAPSSQPCGDDGSVTERIGTPGGTADRPALFFADAAEFGRWLEAHHDTADDLWMGLWRRDSGMGGIEWPEAVREALCWGWIDSRVERIDERARRQRWTPRRRGSTWSRVNILAVEELTAQGRMRPSGLAAFEARREDRSGTYSFEQQERSLTPEQEAVLRADTAAAAFWDVATSGYRRVVVHWVNDAKQAATRERRLAQLVEDCAAGRLVKPQRYGEEPAWLARARAAARAADGTDG